MGHPQIPPRIRASGVTADERDQALTTSRMIQELDSQTGYFRAAVSLFDFCYEKAHSITNDVNLRRSYLSWMHIAARDGAMTIYHFGKALAATETALNRCPSINSAVDTSQMRLAKNSFKGAFPDFEAMRHAVAHAAELSANPESHNKNSFSGTYKVDGFSAANVADMTMSDLIGRNYTATFEGRIIEYELSLATGDRLESIKNRVFAAVAPAAELSKKLSSGNLGNNPPRRGA